MGTTISVSSSVYNLAGDIKYRPQFLKMLVFNYVLGASNASIGDTLSLGYLNGPGIKLRQFGRWAIKSGYNEYMGLTSANLLIKAGLDNQVLLEELPLLPGESGLQIATSYVRSASGEMFADQWVSINAPTLFNANRSVRYREDTGQYVINWEDSSRPPNVFTVADFDEKARYIYVQYRTITENAYSAWLLGEPVVIPVTAAFPNTAGWDVVTPLGTSIQTVDMLKNTRTVISYSDGRPDEVSETLTLKTASYQKIFAQYKREGIYVGTVNGEKDPSYKEERWIHEQIGPVNYAESVGTVVDTVAGGVTRTTTTTVLDPYIDTTRQHRTDERLFIPKKISYPRILIYKENTGNSNLDAMFGEAKKLGQFYTYIPFRLNNKSVADDTDPLMYKWSEKAYRRAVGGSYKKTLAQVEDNESIKDIDYVYAVFGVSLNTKEPAALEYIYRLFKRILTQAVEGDGVAVWEAEYAAAAAINKTYSTWFSAQKDPTNPLFGTPSPSGKVPYPERAERSLKVSSSKNGRMNFNMEIVWSSLSEASGTGKGRPGAKKGDIWWTNRGFAPLPGDDSPDDPEDEDGWLVRRLKGYRCSLTWQTSANTWQQLDFFGLRHHNHVYKGNSVRIEARDALEDPEESGFLVPIHQGIYEEMPLVRSTQMATACAYLVFNSYVETKKKWYQRGFFKVIVIIIAVVVTVYSGGTGAGLLGSASSVGASLGLTGLAAVVVGAVVNAVAAMVLMNIIQVAATKLFGAKWGAIIGTVVGLFIMNVGSSSASGGSITASMGSMMEAQNIMKLLSAAGDAYSKYITADTQDIYKKIGQLQETYKGDMKAINEMYAEQFGLGSSALNPVYLLDAANDVKFSPESSDAFLSRTLMVGSDIVDMSLDLLNNFAEITLNIEMQT